MGTEQWCCNFAACFLAVIDPVLSPASPQAEALSHLFVITLFVCGVIFTIVAALVWFWPDNSTSPRIGPLANTLAESVMVL